MAIDLTDEAMQIVRGGLSASPLPMTRKRRWEPLFAQRSAHCAIVLLAARSRRRKYLWHAIFASVDGDWTLSRTGGQELDTGIVRTGSHDRSSRTNPDGYILEGTVGRQAGSLSYCIVRFTSEVSRVTFAGESYDVPPIGYCAMAWADRKMPSITIVDRSGEPIGSLTEDSFTPDFVRSRGMRLRARWWRRTFGTDDPEGAWLNYKPANRRPS